MNDLERLEAQNSAKLRFLEANLTKAVISSSGKTQTRIRIWSWLELLALEVMKAVA